MGRSRTLTDVVDGLKAIEQELLPTAKPKVTPFTTASSMERVTELLGSVELDERTLRRFVHFRPDRYARYSVNRSELFDVIVLCWDVDQGSPIHDHAGQVGWIRVIRGRILEEAFHLHPDCKQTATIGAERTASDVVLEADERTEFFAGQGVATVDRRRCIHRMGNPREHADTEPTVTLHVYSRPHDRCLAFDAEAKTCQMLDLNFHELPDEAVG